MSQGNSESPWKRYRWQVGAGLTTAAVVAAATWWWNPIWGWLLEPVEVARLWLGLLILFVVLVVGFVVLVVLAKRIDRSAQMPPAWIAYQEDEFFGLLWRWWWEDQRIAEMRSYCPVCKRFLRYAEDGLRNHLIFTCPCGNTVRNDGPMDDLKTRVRIEIGHKIEHGTWKATDRPGEKGGSS